MKQYQAMTKPKDNRSTVSNQSPVEKIVSGRHRLPNAMSILDLVRFDPQNRAAVPYRD